MKKLWLPKKSNAQAKFAGGLAKTVKHWVPPKTKKK